MHLNRISIPGLSSALLCVLLVTACGGGETKQAQCQKIASIVNSLGSVNTTEIKTMGELGLSAVDDLDALELDDQKLSNLRSHLSKSMKASAEATVKLADLEGPDGNFDDSPEAQAILAQTEEASTDFQSKLKATQAYCNGGTAPDELTSKPAS